MVCFSFPTTVSNQEKSHERHVSPQQSALLNIVVGIVGAMIGGFLLGGPTINSNALNMTALIVSFVGAVILLAIDNLATAGASADRSTTECISLCSRSEELYRRLRRYPGGVGVFCVRCPCRPLPWRGRCDRRAA
jgi:uncharacterized membrane protein YeaQ/YmgE (transglycosylase-associated protein family)